MKCSVCNTEFEGRSDAKYCSSKCRVAANRNKDVELSVTSVTDNAKCNTEFVTDNTIAIKPGFEGFKMPDGFDSLPADVRGTISRLSSDPEEFRRRTSIALDYQKMFPNNIHKGVPFECC